MTQLTSDDATPRDLLEALLSTGRADNMHSIAVLFVETNGDVNAITAGVHTLADIYPLIGAVEFFKAETIANAILDSKLRDEEIG